MENNLIVSPSGELGPSTVRQDGEKNVYVNNNEKGIVNFNITQQLPGGMSLGELLGKLQRLNKQYYNLLVTLEDIQTQNYVSITSTRALVKGTVPEEIYEKCSSLSDEGIAILSSFPCIVCHENTEMYGRTDPNQIAYTALVTKIRKSGKTIRVYFERLDSIPQHLLGEHAFEFDLNTGCAITDLNISRWTVKKVNLAEAFVDAGIESLIK